MWIEKLDNNENNIVSDLNTTFEDSLNSWFYVINRNEYKWRKVVVCITKDGQYSFYFALEKWNLEILWNRKEVVVWYTLDQTVEELQWFFSFFHNYKPVYSYEKKELLKEDLENIWKLETFLSDLEREAIRQNVNNILD